MNEYKNFMVGSIEVSCFDADNGFTLNIEFSLGNSKVYSVYSDSNGSTHIDEIMEPGIPVYQSEKEYVGKVNEHWTGSEEEAADYILNTVKQ